jgi:hypothetical protein
MKLYLENTHHKKGLKEWLKWKSNCIAGIGPQFGAHGAPQYKAKQKSAKPLLMINNTVVISMHLTILS